ncbi:MAG: CsbD family protein [Planctomycetia bacterium]|nr:CsbD family protein [Planctomycetia bacterium]
MGGKSDQVKGRIKEAVGALTGNDKLRDEGKTDQAAGKVKQAVQTAVDNVRKAAEGAVDKAKLARKKI